MTSTKFFDAFSLVVTRGQLVVTRGHSWSLVVTHGHSWSFVVTRGHSWSLVCTFRHDQKNVGGQWHCVFVCLFLSFVIEYGPCFIFVEK